MSARVDVDDGAFLAALPAAIEEWRVESFAVADLTADKVVDTARGLVAKRTGHLEATIHRDPLVRTSRDSGFVQIVAGDGTRYAIYVEFGTFKDRAQPFMRPALAMAAGALRAGGFEARMAGTSKTRAAVRRSIHRKKLRRAVKAGHLTAAEAARESRRISNIRKFRG